MSIKPIFLLGLLLIFGACEKENISDLPQELTSVSATDHDLEATIQKYKKGELDQAELEFKKYISNQSVKGNELLFIKSYTNLGNIYADRGNNPVAFDYYSKALKLAESASDTKNIANIQKNIGTLYVSWQQFEKAIDFYEKAMQTGEKLNDDILIADCHNNIGIIKEQESQYDEAILDYQKALELYQKHAVKEGVAMAESNLAIVYKFKKNYQESIQHNLKALKISEEIEDKWSQASILNNIGNLYREMGNYKHAREFAENGLNLAKEMDAQEIIYQAYETLAQIEHESGNSDKAMERYQQFTEVKDAFINTESTRQLSDLQVKYETEKKEKALTETQLKLSQKEVASKQKNIWLIVLGSGLALGFVVFRNFSIKSRLKEKQLKLEKQLVEEQAIASIQNQRLEISRELHDSVGSQLTFIKSIVDTLKSPVFQFEQKLEQKINALSEFTSHSISELRDTIWVLNSDQLHLSELKMKMLNFVRNAADSTDETEIIFLFEFSDDLHLTSKETVNIFRTFQEIINNALKYAKSNNINIKIQQIESHFQMEISDDGLGFEVEKNKEKSFGLTHIYNRMQEIGGKVNLSSEMGKGTRYFIEIELQNSTP